MKKLTYFSKFGGFLRMFFLGEANNHNSLSCLIEEIFYFFSALLLLGAVIELFFPGLFVLYFNVVFLIAGWLVAAGLILFYVRK